MFRASIILATFMALTSPAQATIFINNTRTPVQKFEGAIKAIGFLERPGGYMCTAVMVSKNMIATNAHCILNEDTKKLDWGKGRNYVFYPHLNLKVGPLKATVTKILEYGTLKPKDEWQGGKDWALLRLDHNLGDRTGWMEPERIDLKTLERFSKFKNLKLVGYSLDTEKATQLLIEEGRNFVGVYKDIIFHNFSGYYGTSGAPIFYEDPTQDNRYRLVALFAGWHGEAGTTKVRFEIDLTNYAAPVANFYEAFERHR